MKTYQILCKQFGEISYTPKDPIAIWENQVDLNETIMCLYSSDDYRLVPVKLYEVRNVDLPNWLSPEEYIKDIRLQIKTNAMPIEVLDSLTRIEGLNLLSLEYPLRQTCINLLRTKAFRSEFRASLRKQLEEWLKEEKHRFPSPFSAKQMVYLTGYRTYE